ncbi:hypothetical protein [Paenibacillus sabinae]|uniref:Uncharacterized protein n=1 Tax=Paenibacillus sabinae T27 TaxID=1268072 RepID=X4Z8U9_9BACL|nr:hypothetical protein [Paenibacillus sabinae]AHV96136.1 hypothetical protein PSAB_06000 [Paenibacillus sabinae T27]
MRRCYNCECEIPPETEHYIIDGEGYCTDCVESKPYTAYNYYIDGEYAGCSEDDTVSHVEAYEDEYEIEEVNPQ